MTSSIETKCPICQGPVTKVRESDRAPEGQTVCINEYYVHYTTPTGKHHLNKFTEANVSESEIRFML